MRPVVVVAGLLAVTLAGGLTACGEDDPYADYCAEVEAQQKALTEAQAAGGATALIDALPSFRALQEESPRDLTDEWDQIVGRIDALVAALEDAGVDPSTYDRDQPPAGLSDEQKTAIDAAARELTAPATVQATEGVQQHALDVCQTPLAF
ncbi:MAG: hypothetical protein Q8O61_07845 [Nocardioides sp.]|nr:hypothetical protein [Nocardioides sp.]